MYTTRYDYYLELTRDLKKRYDELTPLLAAPEIIAHVKLFIKYANEHARLQKIIELREKFTKLLQNGYEDEAKAVFDLLKAELSGSDFVELVLDFSALSKSGKGRLQNFIESHMSYAKSCGFSTGILSENRLSVCGIGAAELMSRSGVYEKNIVLTIVEAPSDEFSFEDRDIKIDIFHSGGAGGQNVNKVETAVRMTHVPSGVVVVCQDERSQLKNKNRARERLFERVNDFYKRKKSNELERRIAEVKKNAKKIISRDDSIERSFNS